MLMKELQSKLLLFVLFITCLLLPRVVSANTQNDITQEGIDFLTDPPKETMVYTAGEGTVTYEPAQNGRNAVITLENATINGKQTAYYQGQNWASAAILMAGNVDMVLQGENKITITKNYTQGLFCFNGNLNVKGSGDLTIDIQAALNGPSGIEVLCGKDATEDMGNFALTGGNITLRLPPDDPWSYCLSANKDVTIEDGGLSIENGSCSIVSIGGDIKIRSAAVSCKDFNDTGLYAFDGDVIVEGENTVLTIAALENEPYSLGIFAEGQNGSPAISISGGMIEIAAGQSGICTDGGGSITVSGGKVSTKAENTDPEISAVGLWATGRVDIMGGTLHASGIADLGLGIYSDISISVSGGDVTAQGTSQAISTVPDTDAYKKLVITAATDFEGKLKEDFSAENVESYRYLHIIPEVGRYIIRYENDCAMINASQATEAVVIFAAYDDSRLIDLEVKVTNLLEGENVITPEHFLLDEGKIKVVLWDSISDMNPLCGAYETFIPSAQ